MENRELFELRYGGYEFLRDLDEDPGSYTYRLLENIGNNDLDTYLKCFRKMQEETNEAKAVLERRHSHKDKNRRETMLNEVEQMTYWPQLVTVGSNIEYDILGVPDFLNIGYDGTQPDEVKNLINTDIENHPEENSIIIFRTSLVEAGNFIRDFNNQIAGKQGIIKPEDIAQYDLEKMKNKEYLRQYMEENNL